jgi:hypothetical protein
MEEDLKDMMEGEERKTGKETLTEAPAVDAGLMGEREGEARKDTVEVERIDTKTKRSPVSHLQNCPQAGLTSIQVVIV